MRPSLGEMKTLQVDLHFDVLQPDLKVVKVLNVDVSPSCDVRNYFPEL